MYTVLTDSSLSPSLLSPKTSLENSPTPCCHGEFSILFYLIKYLNISTFKYSSQSQGLRRPHNLRIHDRHRTAWNSQRVRSYCHPLHSSLALDLAQPSTRKHRDTGNAYITHTPGSMRGVGYMIYFCEWSLLSTTFRQCNIPCFSQCAVHWWRVGGQGGGRVYWRDQLFMHTAGESLEVWAFFVPRQNHAHAASALGLFRYCILCRIGGFELIYF
jgi:hypothetical protein